MGMATCHPAFVFSIPMRGNEMVPPVCATCPVRTFSIPMRGNEKALIDVAATGLESFSI